MKDFVRSNRIKNYMHIYGAHMFALEYWLYLFDGKFNIYDSIWDVTFKNTFKNG